MKPKKSPIQPKDLNCIGKREAESFFDATQCDAMLILAFKDGHWSLRDFDICAHDLLEIAAHLIQGARLELKHKV